LPINLQVMVVKPVVPWNHALLTQVSDCELSALRVKGCIMPASFAVPSTL
jgi:hypothetical protein